MNNRKILSAVCHGSIYFSSVLLGVGIPLIIMLVSDDPIVQDNAKESINTHINLIVAYIVFGLLSMIVIGLPFLALAGIYNIVMPLVAICAVASNPDRAYSYPFMMFHLLGARTDSPLLKSDH